MVNKFYIVGLSFFLIPILLTPGDPLVLPSVQHQGIPHSQRIGTTSHFLSKFKDATLESGLFFSHRQGDEKLTGLNEVLGPGACAFDYDNDGWVDLFLVNGSGESRYYGKNHWWQQNTGHQLFKNIGNARFDNVSESANINANSWGMGCATADLDNDGDQDLIITNIGKNILYRNNGDGSFSDVTAHSGMTDKHWSTSVTIGDFDRDGLPDLYVTNYIRYEKGAYTYEKQNNFSAAGKKLTFTSSLYDAVENRLYRNEGNLRFIDVTQQYGVANAGGRSLDATWLDVNADTYLDLYIVNDIGIGSNTLYINRNGTEFIESSMESKAGSSGGHTSVSSGDIDNDGDVDFLLTSRITHTHNLLINNSLSSVDGTVTRAVFDDESRARGIGGERGSGSSGWGAGFHDFNNDGWQDIFIANGMLLQENESPRVTVGQKNELWINAGNAQFQLQPEITGTIYSDRESSRGVTFADFNNDGSIDIYTSSNNGMGQLLLNHNTGKWLSVRLQGGDENRDALGSYITIYTEEGSQQRFVGNRSSFLSTSEERLHFGLGNQSAVTSLEVQWYDGTQSTFEHIEANQHLLLLKGNQQLQLQSFEGNNYTSKAGGLRLKIGRERSNNRAEYVSWLPLFLEPEEALHELEAALSDESKDVRLGALEALRKVNHPRSLSLTINAFSDPSPAVRLAALELVCTYENEYVIRWLLREFYGDSPQHRKAVAECFEFYFREEEAVVHRKGLAIPYLISLLDDKDDEVVIASIKALAEAENFRAVSPLIRLIRDSERSEEVTVNAVRAIGLIRERSALNFVTKELISLKNTPVLRAQLMIALKRLDPPLTYQQIELLALPHLYADKASQELIVRDIETLLSLLLTIQHDAVFNARLLFESLNSLYEKHKELFNTNEKLFERYLRTLTLSPETSGVMTGLLDHPNPEVRRQVLLGLINKSSRSRNEYVKRAFSEPDAILHQAVIELLNNTGGTVSNDIYFNMLSDSKSLALALQLKYVTPNETALQKLLAIASDRNLGELLRVDALKAIRRSDAPQIALPSSVTHSEWSSIRAQALYYIDAQLSAYTDPQFVPHLYSVALQLDDPGLARTSLHVLAKSQQKWAKEIVAETLQQTQPLKLRKLALAASAQFSVLPHNTQQLYLVAKDPADPLKRVALRLLAETQQLHYYPDLIDGTLNENDHFIIAKSLIEAGSVEAFKKLRIPGR